jgi:predicted HTH transcriptional regulator
MINRTTKNKIRLLEKQIELIKTMQMTGKISPKDAKNIILDAHKKINRHLEDLPAHEKELYLLRREFGQEFA